MPWSAPRHNQHRVDANRLANQKEYNQKKRTGQAFYNSQRWRKLRNWYIKANPLCVDCKSGGLIVAGDVVDHINPVKNGGAAYSSSNLQTLCTYHHGLKTAGEKAGDLRGENKK